MKGKIKGEFSCDSGYATRAWKYLEREGLVTGGSYRNARFVLSLF
jgi:hypothetical protein